MLEGLGAAEKHKVHAVADALIEAVLGAVVQVHGVEALNAMQVAGTHEHKDVAHVPLAGGVAAAPMPPASRTWSSM